MQTTEKAALPCFKNKCKAVFSGACQNVIKIWTMTCQQVEMEKTCTYYTWSQNFNDTQLNIQLF